MYKQEKMSCIPVSYYGIYSHLLVYNVIIIGDYLLPTHSAIIKQPDEGALKLDDWYKKSTKYHMIYLDTWK